MTPRGPGALCDGPGGRTHRARLGPLCLRHQLGLNRIPRFGHRPYQAPQHTSGPVTGDDVTDAPLDPS
jgi:hypothetical protein